MNSRRAAAFALLASAMLVLTAMGAGAYTGSALVVGSIHTTDTDFNNAQERTNITISGSGDAAEITLADQGSKGSYNIVDTQGDGTLENPRRVVGDYDNTAFKSEIKMRPDSDGYIQNISVDIGGSSGSDYGFVVDIYIKQESDVDGNYTEGTKVVDNWDPQFSTGVQTIDTDSLYEVSANTNYTVSFVTNSTDNDGTDDWLSINMDDSASSPWWNDNQFGLSNQYANLTLGFGTKLATSATYVSQNHSVQYSEQGFVNITQASNVSINTTWYEGDGTQLTSNTYTTAGNKSQSWATSNADNVYVNVSVEKTGDNPAFALADEGVQFTNDAPAVDNATASPTGGLDSAENTFTIDVTDSQFPTTQGDSVNASLYVNGTYKGSDTLTSNGTASVIATISEGGDHQYHWELEDSYGGTATSDTFDISSPANLTIRDEQTLELINDSTVTAQYYTRDLVLTKETTTGYADFSGAPADEEFVVFAQTAGYYDRRIIVESLYDQSTIYLLNESANATDVEFQLRDLTGNFESSETKLMVKKAVNESGESSYKTIAGDYFGADGSFPVILERNERYLLTIKNQDGDQRDLGYWMATDPDAGIRTLTVGKIEPPPRPTDQGYVAQVQTKHVGNDTFILFKYRDTAKNLTQLTLDVYERGNPSNSIYSDTANDPGQEYYKNITVPDDPNVSVYMVNWTAERGGKTIGQTIPVSVDEAVVTGIPLGEPWLGTIGFYLICWVPTLGGGRYAPEGLATTVGIAGMLMAVSVVNIQPTFWTLAALVSVSWLGVKYGGGVR